MKSTIIILTSILSFLSPLCLTEFKQATLEVTPLQNIGLIKVEPLHDERRLHLNHFIKGNRLYVECFLNGFHFTEEKVGTLHEEGEGHIRLYVDGDHVETLYQAAFSIAGLSKGEHEIKVVIAKNDRSAYGIEESFFITI